jgi:carbonic anhydrase
VFGTESERLVKDGEFVRFMWKIVERYDYHWNGSLYSEPRPKDMKWYHFCEPRVVDVTDYDDIVKALDDGRMERIVKEYERYEKEYKD